MPAEVEDGPPNFFCRLPTSDNNAKKIDRSASPPPLAFLQHILNSYQPEQQEDEAAVLARPRWVDGLGGDDGRERKVDASSAGVRNGAASDSYGNGLRHSAQRKDIVASSSSTAASSAADEDGENEEDDAPWFSQLANLPQVRSAGIPMVAPASGAGSSTGARSTAQRPKHHPQQQYQQSMRALLDPAASLSSSSSSNMSHSNNNRSTMEPNNSSGSLLQPSSVSSSSSLSSDAMADSMSSSLASLSMEGINPLTISTTTTTKATPSLNESKAKAVTSTAMPPPPVPPIKPQLVSTATMTNNPATTSTSSAPLVPPENFAMVNSWVYRSSFPKKRHFPFLKTLGLKSVLTLILEEYPEQNTRFLDENGITFFQFGIPGNKEPFVQIPQDKITAALITILDRRNHPILIHCNKGKHRTGCLIGCLRKLQQWSLTTIFDEYRRFSFPKSRSMDQEFIELYSERVVWLQVDRFWLPRWSVLGKNGRAGRLEDVEGEGETGGGRGKEANGDVTAASFHSPSSLLPDGYKSKGSLALTAETIHRLKLTGM